MKQRHFQIELVNSPCCYNSVEVEAAKGVPDRQPMLRAAQLFF
jgi:hypothetical protein